MKLDVLIMAAHPDDAEFAMGGTILKLLSAGHTVGIADFTRGELGTRGSADIRVLEAGEADRRLGLTTRVNLGFRDGFFSHDENHVMQVVDVIRRFQPDVIFSNPPDDRHPDHGRAHYLIKDAIFLSGLSKIVTGDKAKPQQACRPARHFHYIQHNEHTPQFVVDISAFWEKKMHVIRAYESQLFKEDSNEPETIMTCRNFWGYIEARGRVMGHMVGGLYGEGFLSSSALKVENVIDLI